MFLARVPHPAAPSTGWVTLNAVSVGHAYLGHDKSVIKLPCVSRQVPSGLDLVSYLLDLVIFERIGMKLFLTSGF